MSRAFDRSRLVRTRAKQTKKQIILFSLAIVITLFIFLNFGPLVLNFVGGALSGKNSYTIPDSKNVLDAPSIREEFSATDSASIKVSGTTGYRNAEVELYVNNSLEDKISVDEKGTFTFSDVELNTGENTIKARVIKDDDTSDYSPSYEVKRLSSDAPKLDVTFPQDNQTLQKGDQEINVTGSTDSENTVTVNNFRAIVDSSGNFSYYIRLNDGENTLSITAQNPAGRATTKTLKVTYKP